MFKVTRFFLFGRCQYVPISSHPEESIYFPKRNPNQIEQMYGPKMIGALEAHFSAVTFLFCHILYILLINKHHFINKKGKK